MQSSRVKKGQIFSNYVEDLWCQKNSIIDALDTVFEVIKTVHYQAYSIPCSLLFFFAIKSLLFRYLFRY